MCKTLDDRMNIILDKQLPVYDGAEIPYRCAGNRVRKVGNIPAICSDGQIVVSDPCIKIGIVRFTCGIFGEGSQI